MMDSTFQKLIPDLPKEEKEKLKNLIHRAVEQGVSNEEFDDVDLKDY